MHPSKKRTFQLFFFEPEQVLLYFIESHKTFENKISTSSELSTLSLYIFCLLYITLFRPFLCLLIPSVDRFSGEKRPAQLARRIMMAYSDRIKSTSDGAAHR